MVDELHALIYRIADAAGIPRVLLLALVEAESRQEPEAERWYLYTDRAKNALANGDMAALQDIVNEIVLKYGSSDISFGLTQRTWRWSQEYAAIYGRGNDGATNLDALLAFRHNNLNPEYNLTRSAAILKGYLDRADIHGDVLRCLYCWNRPALGTLPTKIVQQNYQDSLKRATQWVKEDEEAGMADHEFILGFQAKAQELGADVVGEPVEDEIDWGTHVVQTTTKGLMWYSKEGNVALFLPGR